MLQSASCAATAGIPERRAAFLPCTGRRGQLGRSQLGKRVEVAGVPKRRMSEGYCLIGISLR